MAAAYRGMDIAAVANSPALKSVGHRQCATLVRLQSNFLCQHNVACDEITFGHEAPANSRTAGAIDLMDVHRGAVGNSISLSAVAACNVDKKKGAKKRLSDGRRSRQFREWCRKRASAGRGNKAFQAEILAGGKRAAEQLAEMVQGAGDFAENLREFGKNFTAEEMRILREHEPIPQELFDKFLDIIFQMAAHFFELGGLKPPPAKELPHTFVFRFTVCAFAHALQWNAMGGAEKPEKLVNDLIDVNKHRGFRDFL